MAVLDSPGLDFVINTQNIKAVFLDGCKLNACFFSKVLRNNYRRNPDMETTY